MKTKGGEKQVAEEMGLTAGDGGFKIQDAARKRYMTGYPQKCLKTMRRVTSNHLCLPTPHHVHQTIGSSGMNRSTLRMGALVAA
jgi:hypothetical protein